MIRHGLELVCRTTLSVAHLLDCSEGRLRRSVVVDVEVAGKGRERFQVLSDVVIDGFTFGKITDFETETCEYGDAFVIAPDNSRAGLVWEVSDKRYFQEICPLEPNRWGVWGVAFSQPMTSHDNARKHLGSILRELKKQWEEWRRRYTR